MKGSRVFLSWSGKPCQKVAEGLGDLIANLDAGVKPFVSSRNIEIGELWTQKLSSALNSCCCGVLCLAPQALASPWVMFEAGALSKGGRQRRVYPYLLGIKGSIKSGPLAAFQARKASKDATWRLISEILKSVKADKFKRTRALERFNDEWPKLKKTIDAAKDTILAGPRYVPFNRLDDNGFHDLLDLYFDATAHQLHAVVSKELETFGSMMDDAKSLKRKLAAVRATIDGIVQNAPNTPKESIAALVREIGAAELPGAYSSLIVEWFTVVSKQRNKLKRFHHDRFNDLEAFLWQELPPKLLMETVLSGLSTLTQSRPSDRIANAHAIIKAHQAGLRTRIESRLRRTEP